MESYKSEYSSSWTYWSVLLDNAKKFLILGIVSLALYIFYKEGRGGIERSSEEAVKATNERLKKEKVFYSPKSLCKFNGESDGPIYVAICRKVYDVAASRNLYAKGSAYDMFSGKDISLALAKSDLSGDFIQDASLPLQDLSGLSSEERESLESWVNNFEAKYNVAGYLVDNDDPRVGKCSTEVNDFREDDFGFDYCIKSKV